MIFRDINIKATHVLGLYLANLAIHVYNTREAIKKFGSENVVQYGLGGLAIIGTKQHSSSSAEEPTNREN